MKQHSTFFKCYLIITFKRAQLSIHWVDNSTRREWMGRVRVHLALSCGREAVKKSEKRLSTSHLGVRSGRLFILSQNAQWARHANQQVNARCINGPLLMSAWEYCAYARGCISISENLSIVVLCVEVVGMPRGSMGPPLVIYRRRRTSLAQVRAEKWEKRRQLLLHSGLESASHIIHNPDNAHTAKVEAE